MVTWIRTTSPPSLLFSRTITRYSCSRDCCNPNAHTCRSGECRRRADDGSCRFNRRRRCRRCCHVKGCWRCYIEGCWRCYIEGYRRCYIEGYRRCYVRHYYNCSISNSKVGACFACKEYRSQRNFANTIALDMYSVPASLKGRPDPLTANDGSNSRTVSLPLQFSVSDSVGYVRHSGALL